MEHISQVAGHKKFIPKYARKDCPEWARLESGEANKTVKEFIESLKNGTESEAYLFDWSLPIYSPELCQELLEVDYFKDDYLKSVDNALYKSSWPSLFIAPKGIS